MVDFSKSHAIQPHIRVEDIKVVSDDDRMQPAVHSVELCINTDHDSTATMQSSSLESSMSTYDSMMQSLHDELNNHMPVDFGNFDDFDFVKMDCATAISFDYEMNYTIKQLKHIVGYYGIKGKPRKVDIIHDIVTFETDAANSDAVAHRKRLFRYIDILKSDDYLKSYIMM
jgi:hypothetical protein